MKRGFLFVLLLFVFSSLLNADGVETKYNEALKAYKARNFSTSYDILSQLYLSRLSDAKLNFYLGRSAYETGHYEVALAAFERVEMLDAGNLRNRLEMARTYFMLKMYEESEVAFRDVLENPNIPKNVRRNIELYLAKVKGVQKKSFTYATINVDWIYDSNVNYGSLGDFEYGGTIYPSTRTNSDAALQLYGDVVNIYDIGKKGGFAIKNHLIALAKDYQHEDDYDTKYIAYIPSLIYSETKNMYELALGVDDLLLNNNDYLRSIYVMPHYEYTHSTTLRSITYFKYQQKYFQRSLDYDLNADHFELAYGLQKILSPRSYMQGNIVAINETKHHGTRVDVDYNEYKANITYANQFTARYATELFAQYRVRNYADYSSGFGSTRVDNAGNIGADINAKILQTLRVHLKGTYARVSSNQERYSYEKYTVTLGINKTF